MRVKLIIFNSFIVYILHNADYLYFCTGNGAVTLIHQRIMNYKSKFKTRLTSLRIESDILDECKKRGVNVSFACNLFLRSYLYIQKHDSDECPVIGSEVFNLNDLAIDVYNRRKLLY